MKLISKATVVVFTLLFLIAGTAYADPADQQFVEKEWSIFVFMNGDNNLDPFGEKDLKEMEKVGSNDNVNIIVLRDTNISFVSSKIYYVEQGKSTVVKDYGSNIDMGDYRNLVDFFKFARENFPARKYLVDIWNHGGGWVPAKSKKDEVVLKYISYDDHTGNSISTPQLSLAFNQMRELNDGKKIDILGMDACLMQMAEVIYEVKDGVNVVAASEELEPTDGWAYDRFLTELIKNPTMNAEEFGNIIEKTFVESYSNRRKASTPGNWDAQGSVVSVERFVNSLTKLDEFLDYSLNAILPVQANIKSLRGAVNSSQRFHTIFFKDLLHFLQLSKDSINDAKFKTLADETMLAVQQSIVANYVKGTALANAKGISIWIPTKVRYNLWKKAYAETLWGKDTRWDSFIEALVLPTIPE